MNDPISKRVSCLDLSGIRKVFDLARDLKDPINLSIGQPHFKVPDSIKEKAQSAIEHDINAYTPTQGRQDLIDQLKEDNQRRGLLFEDLIVTSGVSGGLFLAFSALLNPGDEVLMTDPYFLMYKQLAKFLDATPKYINIYPDFKPTAEKIEPYLTSKTKLLILNFPGNPTGIGLTPDEMKDLADLLKRYPDITIISDEIYRLFHYSGNFISLASLMDRVITLDGFSKSHAVTGWRVGWAAGPKHILQQMAKLQQFTFVCSPAPAQVGCLKALEVDMDAMRKIYQNKRDMFCEAIGNRYEFNKPDGTFYVFIKTPPAYANSQDFVKDAISKGLLIIPGNVFSEYDTHFRVSFAATDEMLIRGAEVLKSMSS